MLARKTIFPHVIEMNNQAGHVIGCSVYLIYSQDEWVLIDIGYEEAVDEIIELIRQGLSVDGLITHRFGMDDAPAAITTFFEGQAVKTIIQPWGEASSN